MESYPTGPPTCGSSEDPTCKVRITDMSQGGPLVVFSFWILVFVVVLSFQLYRAWYARMHPFPPLIRRGVNSGSSRSTQDKHLRSPTANAKVLEAGQPNDEISTLSSTTAGAATELKIEVEEAELDLEPILRFTGYHRVVAGEICWWLLILTSLQWICIYVVVLVDTYYSCQLTGIDNLCFFGTYFIFGSYDRNGTVFFTIWCISVIWFTVMVVYKREVHNWFMMPCGLSCAHVVHVWAQERQEILSINASRLVHLVRRLKGTYFFRPEQRGHTERLLVLRTEFGTPYFLFQGQRYLIAGDNTLHLARVELGHKYDDFYKLSEGLPGQEALARYDKVGPNEVPFKVETMWVSIAEEMFTLFKVYQFLIYSIWLWFSYLLVGALLFSIVLIAATITIINRRRSQSSIAKLIEYESIVEVKRDNTWRNVDFRMLVPGDVVKVKSNWKLPCDLLILQGICVCNESDLTGEAMPVHKYKARPEDGEVTYEPESARGARHTLFSGTLVLQAGAAGSSTEVLAIVTATGMSTSRGRLLSAILFPEQMVFKYDEELPVVVGMLLCYAAVCFALSLIFQYRNGQQGTWITKWSYCVAIVSQVVSPLLPVALEIGQIYASRRLKIHGVYCLNTKRIAIAGKIRVFCFDKTGTLTNDGLDFVGIQGVENSIVNNESRFRPTQSPWKHELIDDVILRGFATCHAVTKFGAQFVGNEVEVKMFSSVGWDLLEEGTTATQQYPVVSNKTTGDLLTIVRRNEFEHSRATMSVVVQDHTGELHVYCKGSFERIQELSTLESLPLDYLQTAKDHALNGCYVLGLSHKSLGTDMSLDAIRMLSRDDLETGLTFISLLLFRNELKSDTRIAIENLREGEVRPLMVTGDNAQCGFYIAKECAMVAGHVQVLLAEIDQGGSLVWQPMARTASMSTTIQASLSTREMLGVHQKGLEGGLTELAVTGKAFNKLCSTGEMQELLLYTRIFSRCTPEDKVKVIKMHKDLGLVVGMCGDGGNDCGALRSAHAGLALSEAEASVVSPFTSKAKSVSSVVELLREGRAALHTSFACYKFLIIYGLSFSIFKLSANWYGVLPCQMDYLFIDGVAVLTLGYTMNLSNPMKTLRKERPTSSLLGAQNVASVFGMWSINVLFVAGALTFMSAQSDYVKWPAQLSQGNSWWLLGDNWESTVIFFTIYLQFIASSVVFTFGSSFRRTLFRNYLLVGSWVGIFVVVSLALMLPHSSFTHLWHVASEQFNRPNTTSPVWVKYQQHGGAPSPAMSFSFRLQLWVLSLANFVMVAFWQKAVVEGPVAAIIRRKFPSATPKLHL